MEEKKEVAKKKVSAKKEKQDIDKLLMAIDLLEPVGINLKKAMSDGRIDWKDGMYGLELLKMLPKFIQAVKNAGEMFEESKDIDAAEAIAIVQKLYSVAQKIEKA